MKIRKAEGQRKITTEEQNDPFGLYCSYLNTIKPIDYEFDIEEFKQRIFDLEEDLKASEAKSDAIQSACEQYLKEEEELRANLKHLGN